MYASVTPHFSTDKTVEVINTYEDGSMIEFTYGSVEEMFNTSQIGYEKSLVLCTVSFTTGECSTTASTCAAAMAGFRACATALGYNLPR